ncbi:PREDICTED: venom protease-like isoform X2 [Polistes dominula]|uniref:Venom protease-like isoform X2 n=1 Tax=Polistes dominula TaxID=743375 RepID=A0ABM1J2V9_POLDO|nr:PREDICTED: venom protease-like isoform X2 [Polistes dominula]
MLANDISMNVMMLISIVIVFFLNQITISTGNTFFCQNNQQCTFLEYCPDIAMRMKRNEFPIYRFRQSICDYSGLRPKVCCDTISYPVNPTLYEENIRSLLESRSYYKCGKSLIKNNIDNFGSYPFLARIGFINLQTGHIKYPCSGTIISERAIVTTASCALANSQIYKLYVVTIGEFNTETDPDCNSLLCGYKVRHYNISYIIKHPNYCADNFENNIALIRLERPIHFEVTAQPVCLLPKEIYIRTGSNTVLIGWGRLSDQKDMLNIQQELKMVLLPKQNCLDFINEGYSVELCASGETEPCSAYNGSPLLYKYSDTYFLVGILSYGSNCDDKSNLPVVFVDVKKYTRWLLENL